MMPLSSPVRLLVLLSLLAAGSAGAQDLLVSGAEAADALKQALRVRGLVPPPESPLSLDDYITTEWSVSGYRLVGVGIGPEGHVLPTAVWRYEHPEFCEQQARLMRQPGAYLEFEVLQLSDTFDGREHLQIYAFARLRDAETHTILELREGKVTRIAGADLAEQGTVADALEGAFAGIRTSVMAPDSPCGTLRVMR